MSALTPTPAGEGKTTVSIGLAQGLQAIGKRACLALREPSMGPVFGRKGGATAGGASSIAPGESINLYARRYGRPVTVAINLFAAGDTEKEIIPVYELCEQKEIKYEV